MELDKAILQLFPGVDFFAEVKLRQDPGGDPYIFEWNRPEPQPTPAELTAAWQAWLADQPARDAAQAELDDAAAFEGLPEWAGYTAAIAADAIHDAILAGDTLAQAQAKIDALPATIAGMKTGLKAAAAEMVTIRGIMEKMAKAVVYLRDRTD